MPPKGRKVAVSKKKKQTRLTFDPVDPSSSAPKGPSPAKVRFKKPKGGSLVLMRPVQSSGTVAAGDSNDDDILFSSSIPIKDRSASSKKSAAIPFLPILPTPIKSSQRSFGGRRRSPSFAEDDFDDEITRASPHTPPPFTGSAKKSSGSMSIRSRRLSANVDVDSSDGSPPEDVTPSKRKGRAKALQSPALTILGGDKQREVIHKELPKSRATSMKTDPEAKRPRRTPAQKTQTYVELSSDSESAELPQTNKFSRRKLISSKMQLEDSDSDAILLKQPARRPRQPVKSIEEDNDSEDPISSPLKRARPVVESDESDIISSPLKRRRQVNAFSMEEGSEGDSGKIKSRNGAATPSRTTRQSKVRRHRSEREKKLELLKRRRAGENIEELTETSESGSDGDEESDFQKLSEFEDEEEEEEEEEVVAKPRKSIKKKTLASGDEADHYDSDFIEDDDELGVPDHSLLDIPLQFTHAAHKPLKDHFKDAVEWMVHKKINPGFNREDPLYIQAFKKLDDEYGGYAKSKFVSTQWTAEFTRAIYARPEFLVRDLAPGEEIEIAGQVICQVCNHRKYVPKYQIQFAGKAYHMSTLEEIEVDSDNDDSDEADSDGSDRRSINADGHEIPPPSKTWLSGQYCKANAEQAHSLIHWKYALNQWVLDTLEFEGHLSPVKLAEREKMKAKQRRRYANDIVDDWEAHNQIKDLYRDFKINLETARETTTGPWTNSRYKR